MVGWLLLGALIHFQGYSYNQWLPADFSPLVYSHFISLSFGFPSSSSSSFSSFTLSHLLFLKEVPLSVRAAVPILVWLSVYVLLLTVTDNLIKVEMFSSGFPSRNLIQALLALRERYCGNRY